MTEHTPTFVEWLQGRIGSNWVLARRTKSIVARYGSNVVALSPKRYADLQSEYETETGLDIMGGPSQDTIAHAVSCHDDLVAALEGMLNKFWPHPTIYLSRTHPSVLARAALAKATQ